MKNRTFRQTSSALAPVLSALLLISCGGGGGGSADPDPDPPPEDPEPGDPIPGNVAPEAFDISISTDASTPLVEIQLDGRDADNDTLTYVLDSPRSGAGYSLAFVGAETGRLNVSLDDSSVESLSFDYRVTDGTQFSETAQAQIVIAESESGGTGASDTAPSDYFNVPIAYFGDTSDEGIPSAVDLSNNFPTPGNQGSQGSCVGWATAYALKSYHEKVEEQWEFSSNSTLFSPAWIYNQINGGVDGGSHPLDALDLIVNNGAATLATMPYDDQNFTASPSAEAVQEAAFYKAASYARVNTVNDIRRSIAARNPVTIGIEVFPSFNGLVGENSVYNDLSGASEGGHAITITGYDDDRFGGAFKVINSWGTGWGDDGYFWLPYDVVPQAVLLALVLEDAPNSGELPEPVQPPADDTLPNLAIVDWTASYNPVAGGAGELQWSVTNNGSAVAPAGADLNLMLSTDQVIGPDDIYLRYENLTFDIEPGGRLFRDENNPLSFQFPLDLPAGEYYMAVWVDDLDEVQESDETDNISFGNATVQIAGAEYPDLVVSSWWATWDSVTGNGELEYRVTNDGNAPLGGTTWDINLILSTGLDAEATFAYYLFYEDGNFDLDPGTTVFRDASNRASFNMYESAFGNTVVPGNYYVSLWVDDLNQVDESREYNNLSTDNQLIPIGSQTKLASAQDSSLNHRFNGKSVPEDSVMLAKVSIEADASGEPRVASFKFQGRSMPGDINGAEFAKTTSAADKMISLNALALAMPSAKVSDGAATVLQMSK